MVAAEPETEDLSFRLWAEWLSRRIDRAADHWGLALLGQPHIGGQGMANAYGPAIGPGGQRWLRIGAHFDSEPRDTFSWEGNQAANAITGLPKPRVLDVVEWRDVHDNGEPWPCTVRAELMTCLPGRPVQDPTTCEWTSVPPDAWWDELDAALAAIRAADVPENRRRQVAVRGAQPADVREVLGVDVDVRRWASEHGDLHWANALREPFGVVDWEGWGEYPIYTGEAHLYITALPFPALAERTWERLAPVLDTEDGRVALLVRGAQLVQAGLGWDAVDTLPPLLRSLGAQLPA